jgi:hypothetical protein
VKKLFGISATMLTAFCVATIVAQVTALGAFWFKGALDPDRLYRVLAAMHGEDVVTMQARLIAAEKNEDLEQPSYEAIETQRTLKSLDLDLRESALENGMHALQGLQMMLETNQTRFKKLKDSYDAHLTQIAENEKATSLREVQMTLEAIKPKQAKEQIVKMIEDDGMTDVVAIMKQMPLDKRKKVFAEFKTPPETEHLYQILTNIRQGEPLASQIGEARNELKTLSPNQ